MKKLSRLLLALGLALCISLTAYAEDAPAAQPTAKEPRTLTARTGTETSLWNAYAFLAQHGTAYRFAPCTVQTPADAARYRPCRGCRGGAAALHHLCGKGYARQH